MQLTTDCHYTSGSDLRYTVIVNDPTEDRGVYLRYGAQVDALNRWEAFIFITVANFTKRKCFRRIKHHRLPIADYPVHPYIQAVQIFLSFSLNLKFDVRILTMNFDMAEQDVMRTILLIEQETE